MTLNRRKHLLPWSLFKWILYWSSYKTLFYFFFFFFGVYLLNTNSEEDLRVKNFLVYSLDSPYSVRRTPRLESTQLYCFRKRSGHVKSSSCNK